jgi:hypothetical protein
MTGLLLYMSKNIELECNFSSSLLYFVLERESRLDTACAEAPRARLGFDTWIGQFMKGMLSREAVMEGSLTQCRNEARSCETRVIGGSEGQLDLEEGHAIFLDVYGEQAGC